MNLHVYNLVYSPNKPQLLPRGQVKWLLQRQDHVTCPICKLKYYSPDGYVVHTKKLHGASIHILFRTSVKLNICFILSLQATYWLQMIRAMNEANEHHISITCLFALQCFIICLCCISCPHKLPHLWAPLSGASIRDCHHHATNLASCFSFHTSCYQYAMARSDGFGNG